MHYLRWEQPITMRAWTEAGMYYDSTLSYADKSGFRCGTCFAYSGFDPVNANAVKIRIRPLIAMEASVLSQKYMGKTPDQGLAVFLDLKRKCQRVAGQFTLLWHNSELQTIPMRRIYQELIK